MPRATGLSSAPGYSGERHAEWRVRTSRRRGSSTRFLTAQALGPGNWRVVFRFEDGEAVDVGRIDYH